MQTLKVWGIKLSIKYGYYLKTLVPHSKREYDRLQIKYENTYQRWRKVIGLNKNLLRKLARPDDAIAQLKLEVTALKARESKLIKEDSQRQVQAVESQQKTGKYSQA